ncbi:replicative DNA helicase [Caminibacter mediatlanticus TB-2]|uniref:Replicative DNA helicase n=1 Tax=Caminibacter mediatlanticus TB-2 TaxID=391592 RepID=A0AAI9AHJ8_9BACT|nr:replicative DNA helicase [Caminibacter mediatlanticus]EDM24326.1 replicative DNA helicase [Caminibacter mediatlanticus TB-2]QCT94973.1 replicative DNA helicase [Caminibacter mediatlanticus TB-2]
MNLYNLDIERGILSAILLDGKIYEDVASILKPSDFYLPFHQAVFETMEELYKKDLPIDEVFLKEALKKKNKFDDELFLEIIGTAPIEAVESYAKELKDLATKRELIHLSNEIKKIVLEEDKRAIEEVEEIQSKLFHIATSNLSGDFKIAENVITDTLEFIKKQAAKKNKIVTGLDTGFIELNRMTSGFGEGDLIIIAARPSMGKTAFALNIALNVVKQDKGVAIFSLEMPAEQLMLRMMSAYAKIPLQDLRRGNLSDEEWSKLSEVADDLSNRPLFVDDEGNINIHTIRAKLRKLKAQNPNLSLAIIDYLQLISSDQRERHLAIAEISRSLKLLARELQIPIIALSQLNRALESRPNKRPMLSDLRESGAIEQDADIIMFIYRDDVYKAMEARQKQKEALEKGKSVEIEFKEKEIEDAEIIIGKQRNGPTGTVEMLFNKKYTLFTDKVSAVNEVEPTEANIEVPSTLE